MTDTGKSTPFRDWWARHDSKTNGADRAVFARLRRCGTPEQALMEPAALLLARRLGVEAHQIDRLRRIGVIAAVLAHVRGDDPLTRFAERLGAGDPKPLSVLRFGVLMTAPPGAPQLDAFRRAVAITGRTANVEDLGGALWRWGERTRLDWTFRYWGAGAAASAIDIKETAL
jgi:CRISPR type I-E-associated protein CasB/Cse2